MKKNLKKLTGILLLFSMVFALTACAPMGKEMPDESGAVENGAVIGQGSKTFAMEVTDGEGKVTAFTVKSDADTVGAALLALGIIAGEDSQYGLTIITVDGEAAVWATDNAYWAIWIGEEMAMTGASETPVYDGSIFKLEYTGLG